MVCPEVENIERNKKIKEVNECLGEIELVLGAKVPEQGEPWDSVLDTRFLAI